MITLPESDVFQVKKWEWNVKMLGAMFKIMQHKDGHYVYTLNGSLLGTGDRMEDCLRLCWIAILTNQAN